MIGNLFDVSIDYLLKDTTSENQTQAEGYFINQSRVAKYVALGFFSAGYGLSSLFLFQTGAAHVYHPGHYYKVIGFGIIVSGGMLEEDKYKILKQEPLLLDEKYLKELKARYEKMKKKYAAFTIAGICLFAAGFLLFGLGDKYKIAEALEPYHPASIILIAVGLYMFTRTATVLEGYELLTNNEKHVRKLSFKIRRKFRKKVNGF